MAEAGETAVYGGYEYEFADKLDGKFYCLVCHNVLRDPILTGCCGQHYCESCLEQCNSTFYDKKCPHCRQLNYTTLLDKPLQREIKGLKVFCVNRSLGCKWSKELEKLPRHLESNKDGCEFVRVECVLNCGEKITRGHLTKHLNHECPQRPYECGYCGKEDTYTKITGDTKVTRQKGKVPEEKAHFAVCLEFIKRCPNQCGRSMKRREIEQHRQKCPREEIECTFRGPNEANKMMTCGKKVPRSELQSHEKTCPFRTFECKFCNRASTYVAITGERGPQSLTRQPRIPPAKGHYAECPEYPLFCKHKCQPGEIKRRDMEEHITTCPLEPVACPVRDAGCRETVCRKDLKDHLANDQLQHLTLLCSAHTQTKAELEQVKTWLNETRNSLATTSEQLGSVSREVGSSRAEVAALTARVVETERKLEEARTSSRDLRRELAEVKAELAAVQTVQKKKSERTEEAVTVSDTNIHAQPRRIKSFWRKK